MPRIDESVINFALYEDANEYLGMAEVALPELASLTQEITGAGIAGNVEAVDRKSTRLNSSHRG